MTYENSEAAALMKCPECGGECKRWARNNPCGRPCDLHWEYGPWRCDCGWREDYFKEGDENDMARSYE